MCMQTKIEKKITLYLIKLIYFYFEFEVENTQFNPIEWILFKN